ncbi:hypothetical protein NP493_38g04062 [Ridgeia piscesae]|uniref:Deltamethrin resistance protein prag01 domain-containing protein n=1 Tax=Ridgeia piscesae TaxID=27915 RepID=A0AAD9UJR3_RIDPI|nr:hypothetical protein NP493_38g04062 [Ridgeia piscesae]
MLGRILASRAATAVSRVSSRKMSGHTPATWKTDLELAQVSRTTLNDLPIPAGSWQANYAKKQAKYNIQLALASVLMSCTLVVMYKSGVLYFHRHPNLKSLSIHPERL